MKVKYIMNNRFFILSLILIFFISFFCIYFFSLLTTSYLINRGIECQKKQLKIVLYL